MRQNWVPGGLHSSDVHQEVDFHISAFLRSWSDKPENWMDFNGMDFFATDLTHVIHYTKHFFQCWPVWPTGFMGALKNRKTVQGTSVFRNVLETKLWLCDSKDQKYLFGLFIFLFVCVLNMSCLLLILSRVQNFSIGTCACFGIGYWEKKISCLLMWGFSGKVLLCMGLVWEAYLHVLTFWLEFDKHKLWCCS